MDRIENYDMNAPGQLTTTATKTLNKYHIFDVHKASRNDSPLKYLMIELTAATRIRLMIVKILGKRNAACKLWWQNQIMFPSLKTITT